MRAENAAALRFILQDDIYLLPIDKEMIRSGAGQSVAEVQPEPAVSLTESTVTENPAASVAPTQPQPVVQSAKEPLIEAPTITYNYLGDYKKQFLIFTHYPSQQHIADTHLTALQNILKRKDYETADIAIYNLAKNTVIDMVALAKHFAPARVLILGKSAIPVGLESLALNQLKPFKTFSALYSYSFDEMMDNIAYKKAFWEQMKNL